MKDVTVQIDKAGRVVLPKRLRERFRLHGGDMLAIEVRGDAIELRPTPQSGTVQRVNGVLVFSGTAPLGSERDLVTESREERLEDVTSDLKGKQ